MPIIGSNLKEIHLERIHELGSLKLKTIKNNMNIQDVYERKMDVMNIKNALVFDFEFTSDYISEDGESKAGSILFRGEVLYSDTEKEIKQILESWKKKKDVKQSIMLPVLQAAFDIAQIDAIYLSRKVLLPSPIELPRVSIEDNNKK